MLNRRRGLTGACLFLAASCAQSALAQQPQMDMNEMMKWGRAKVVRYHIVGEYEAKTAVSSAGQGFADVKDRVVIDLDWDLANVTLVGQPTFANTVSTATNFRDSEPTCLAPVLKGPYEHYELLKVENGLSGGLKLTVKTSIPVTQIAQFCTASLKSTPAKVIERPEELVLPSPVMFGMGAGNTSELTYLRDKQQIIFKRSGWTWTFSPTVKKT